MLQSSPEIPPSEYNKKEDAGQSKEHEFRDLTDSEREALRTAISQIKDGVIVTGAEDTKKVTGAREALASQEIESSGKTLKEIINENYRHEEGGESGPIQKAA